MAAPRHPNYKKASNLIIMAALLGFVKLFFAAGESVYGSSSSQMVEQLTKFALFWLVLDVVIALLVRFGFGWVKYILLIFTFFGVLSVPLAILSILTRPVTSIIDIAEFGLKVGAIVLLFLI